MTILDATVLAKVTETLATYGMTVTFTVPATKTYDPDTRLTTAGTATEYEVKASPPSPITKFVAGKIVRSEYVEIIIAAEDLGFTPVTAMSVTIDDETWKIVSVFKIRSGDSVAAYQLELKR